MTGFAAQDGGDGKGVTWSWELRGVNARGFDLRLRLPDGLGALEAPLRKRLSDVVARGSITLSLKLSWTGQGGEDALDPAALDLAMLRLQQVRNAADRHSVELHPPTAAEILALLPGAERTGQSDLPGPDLLLADAEPLITAFCAMRHAEGAALVSVLADQTARIEELIERAAKAAAARQPKQAERLRANLEAVLQAADGIDEARLTQELALIAAKTDVTEEIDRLAAHVDAVLTLLETGGPVGRKLDFLMQEFNREANTLCSKAQDAALTAIGLDLKLAIDQTREQVQNVE